MAGVAGSAGESRLPSRIPQPQSGAGSRGHPGEMQTPRRLPPDVLRKILEDEEACLGIFYKWRWPCGFVCPRCESREGRRIANRPAWRCVACNHHARVTAGTSLHKSRLPLSKWLHALVFVGDRKQGVSALQLQNDLGFSCYRTAFKMLHIIRDVMEDAVPLCRGVVELAQRTLGPKDARAPADEDGTLLGIAVERLDVVDEESPLPRIGRMNLGIFRTETSWIDVQRAVAPGVPVLFIHSPIHGLIHKNLIDWIRGTFHGISAKYLAAYVREFVFRFNHRRHASIIPGLIGKRLLRPSARRRAALKNPRPLTPPTPPRVVRHDEPDEPDEGDDSGEREEDDQD